MIIFFHSRKGAHINSIISATAAIKPERFTDCTEEHHMLEEGEISGGLENTTV